MTIRYRRAGPRDAAVIDRLFKTSFCDTFAHLYRPEDLEAFLAKFTLDAWTAELSDERYAFQVAEADGQVKGAGRDKVYAVERAVMLVAQARG